MIQHRHWRRIVCPFMCIMAIGLLLNGCQTWDTGYTAESGSAGSWHDDFAGRIFEAWVAGETMPQLSAAHPEATLADGYRVQEAFVARWQDELGIGAYKAAVVGATGQENLGVDAPITGIIPGTGVFSADDTVVVDRAAYPGQAVETEIGYSFHTPITEPLPDVATLKQHVEAIFPCIELPGGDTEDVHPATAADLAAFNGNARAIIAGEKHDPDKIDPDAIAIRLVHNDKVINKAKGGQAAGGQWETLLETVNNLTARGYNIGTEHIITNGALGHILPLEVGTYEAGYHELGVVEFQVVDSGK